MVSDIGDVVEPVNCRRIDGLEVTGIESCQEVFLYVAHRIFDDTLLITFANAARNDGKAVVIGKIQVLRIENRSLSGYSFQYSRFEIIDHDPRGDTSKVLQGALVTAEKMFHGLGNGEFSIHHTTVAQYHDKEAQPSPGIADTDGTIRAPVHLGAFTGSETQLQI